MHAIQFPVLMAASYVVFVSLLRLVLRNRERFPLRVVLILGLVCVCAGMTLAKYGATVGLPWWIYYSIPMLITVFLPPIALRMHKGKAAAYLILSFLAAPVIHAAFSFFLGWKSHMPFIKVPSYWEL